MRTGGFTLLGHRETEDGRMAGPYRVQVVDSLARARELSLAVLWFEKEQWSSISIYDKAGIEVACYRRFPPGRQREYSGEEVGGIEYQIRRGMGARHAVSAVGGRRRSY